jgi:hypothetical protein
MAGVARADHSFVPEIDPGTAGGAWMPLAGGMFLSPPETAVSSSPGLIPDNATDTTFNQSTRGEST